MDFTVAFSKVKEVSCVREEELGFFWENLGLALRANFLPLFFA